MNTKIIWTAVITGVFFTVVATILAATSAALVLSPPLLAALLVLAAALLTLGRTVFQQREEREQQNVEEYRREHPDSELFQESDEALRLAQRANRTFTVYITPVATAFTGIIIAAVTVMMWHSWERLPELPSPGAPLQSAVIVLGLFLAALISGSYFMGTSRESEQRWLRPVGANLFFVSFLYLLSAATLMSVQWKIGNAEWVANAAKFSLVLTLILAAELVFNVIIDLYRPRTSTVERPVYESRLLALFTEPGGIARNIASSLDYQFGFRISEASFYRFFERTFVPFLVLMAVAFWMMTCFVAIETEENGIRKRFGKVVTREPLTPGLHVKLPWPMATIYTFPVERVQKLTVGYETGQPDSQQQKELQRSGVTLGDLSGEVIVWDKQHNASEQKFVVASRSKNLATDTPEPESITNVPVSAYFITASIPLYYKVKDLYDYAFLHRAPASLIEKTAMREITTYLASTSFFDILTARREEGAHTLKTRIQEAADRLDLGIDIVFIGLEGLHPPVRVGEYFNDVVSAMEEEQTMILKAEKYATAQTPDAEAEASGISSTAEGYKYERVKIAEAEANRFLKQLKAYHKSPRIFLLRNYLDVLEQESTEQNKYIISAENSEEIVILDLQEKIRPGLLDVDVSKKK